MVGEKTGYSTTSSIEKGDGALAASSLEIVGAQLRIDPYQVKAEIESPMPPQKGAPKEEDLQKTPPPPDLLQNSKSCPKTSRKSPSSSGTNNSNNRKKKHRYSFPEKLFEMVSSGQTDIIDWVQHGKTFCVKDVSAFEEELLSKFFGHKKMRSFTRQLSYWGFNRVGKKSNGVHEFTHPAFIKGERSLTSKILRTKLKGVGLKRGGVYISLRHTQSQQEALTFINKTEMDCMQDLVTKNATSEKDTRSPSKTDENPRTSRLEDNKINIGTIQSPRHVSVCKLQENENQDSSITAVSTPHPDISVRFVSLEDHKVEGSITTKEDTTILPNKCIARRANRTSLSSHAGNCASTILHRGVVTPATEEQREGKFDADTGFEEAIARKENCTIEDIRNRNTNVRELPSTLFSTAQYLASTALALDARNPSRTGDVFEDRCFNDVQQQGWEDMFVRDEYVSQQWVSSWPSFYHGSTKGTSTAGDVVGCDKQNPRLSPQSSLVWNEGTKPNTHSLE